MAKLALAKEATVRIGGIAAALAGLGHAQRVIASAEILAALNRGEAKSIHAPAPESYLEHTRDLSELASVRPLRLRSVSGNQRGIEEEGVRPAVLRTTREVRGTVLREGQTFESAEQVEEKRVRRPGCIPEGHDIPKPCAPSFREEPSGEKREIKVGLTVPRANVRSGPGLTCAVSDQHTPDEGEVTLLGKYGSWLKVDAGPIGGPGPGGASLEQWMDQSTLDTKGVNLEALPVVPANQVPECPAPIAESGLPKDCSLEVKVDQPLAGPIKFEGTTLNIEAPLPVAPVSFALCDSIKTRTHDVPITGIRFNEGYDEQFGVSAQNEVNTAVLYAHYRAWQHNGDDQFLAERTKISFENYLEMVRQNQDVSHTVWVAKESGSVLDRVPVVVGPETPLAVVLKDGLMRWGDVVDVKYDRQAGVLILEMNVRPGNPKVYPDATRIIGWNALAESGLGFMLYPSEIQIEGITLKNSELASDRQDEMRAGIFSRFELHLNVPVELVAGP